MYSAILSFIPADRNALETLPRIAKAFPSSPLSLTFGLAITSLMIAFFPRSAALPRTPEKEAISQLPGRPVQMLCNTENVVHKIEWRECQQLGEIQGRPVAMGTLQYHDR